MKKIWINKAGSLKKGEIFDKAYYLKMPGRKKLETVQFLREIYHKIKKNIKHEGREGLRRVIKIIQ